MEESLESVKNTEKAQFSGWLPLKKVAAQCWENVVGEETTGEAVVSQYLIMSSDYNGNRVDKLWKGAKGQERIA